MRIGELRDIPIREWAGQNILLFLWVTAGKARADNGAPEIEEGFGLLRAWAFAPRLNIHARTMVAGEESAAKRKTHGGGSRRIAGPDQNGARIVPSLALVIHQEPIVSIVDFQGLQLSLITVRF